MTATVLQPEIDWGYEWRVFRWRRVGIYRAVKRRFAIGLVWCGPCGRMVLSWSFGKFYGSINCRSAKNLVPPPYQPEEFPEFTDELDFFDACQEIRWTP